MENNEGRVLISSQAPNIPLGIIVEEDRGIVTP